MQRIINVLDLYPKNIVDFTKILKRENNIETRDQFGQFWTITSCDNDIIHMDYGNDTRLGCKLENNKYSTFRGCKTKLKQGRLKIFKLGSRGLFQAI